MKILVVSDTHANLPFLQKVWLAHQDADMVFHLGDNFSDPDLLPMPVTPEKLYRVPGYHCPEGASEPVALLINLPGGKIALVHGLGSLPANLRAGANLILHGHTHQPQIETATKIPTVNPGHLKAARDRGFLAGYAILTITSGSLKVDLRYLEGDVYQTQILPWGTF